MARDNRGLYGMIDNKQERDISILRAYAVAGAMLRARPDKHLIAAYEGWFSAVRHLAVVVCTYDGVSITQFYAACGHDGEE